MSMFDPPKVPDPSAGIAAGQQVAAGQQAYNTGAGVQSQAGSMVNQTNPFGSLTYSQTGTGPGGVPIYGSNINLTPEQQQLFDLLQGTKKTAGTQAGDLLSGANYGASTPGDVIGGMTSGTTKDLLSKEVGYLNPFFTTESDQLDTKLKNQGLTPGTPAYDNATRALDTNHGLTVSNFLANAEPQAYAQAKSTYEEPLSMAAKEAAIGAPGNPKDDFVQTPNLNIQPANLTGAVANENDMLMKQYQAQQQQYSSMMAGLFGIPTALAGGWAKGGFALPSLGGSAGAQAGMDSILPMMAL